MTDADHFERIDRAIVRLEERVETRVGRDEAKERIEALDRLTDSKFITAAQLVEATAQQAALMQVASDKAISKAEAATEKRFDSVNEFRKTLSDQTTHFLTKETYDARHDPLLAEMNRLRVEQSRVNGVAVGLSAGITVVGVLISLLIRFAS